MKIPQNKVKTFADRQLSKVFHIAPLVNFFEILHQLKVIIENPHLKVIKFKREENMIIRCYYQTLFLSIEPNIPVLGKVSGT